MNNLSKFPNIARLALLLTLSFMVTGCGQLIANAKKEFAEDLSATILEFDDPESIRRGVPAYLILISSMIKGDPDNADLLESAAVLYGAYASGFADNPESQKALSKRAFSYADRAMCIRDAGMCDGSDMSFVDFKVQLKRIDAVHAAALMVYASSWAGVIEANSDDWDAIAELPKVKAAIQRVIELDETVNHGDAHLYMAVLESLLPPSLGGKPDIAKKHFERAIEISNGQNLMVYVLYAEKYARLLFDRDLHDRLLNQVIEANPGPSEMRLINTLARQQAAILLSDADDYF